MDIHKQLINHGKFFIIWTKKIIFEQKKKFLLKKYYLLSSLFCICHKQSLKWSKNKMCKKTHFACNRIKFKMLLVRDIVISDFDCSLKIDYFTFLLLYIIVFN